MGAKVVVRAATLEDVFITAPRMRQEDREEVWAAAHHRPMKALLTAVQGSVVACMVMLNDEPLFMFGMGLIQGVDGLPDCGVPWALTTDLVDKHPVTFWRVSLRAMSGLRRDYPVMVQVIDKRHRKALAWARQLGFTALDPIPFGPEGLPFVPIILGGEDVRSDRRLDRHAAPWRCCEGESDQGVI